MTWRDAIALSALLLVPAAIAFFWWAFRERDRALATFVDTALLPTVVPDLDRRRRRVRAALLVAAIALFGVALGGPMWGFHWEEMKREGTRKGLVITSTEFMPSAAKSAKGRTIVLIDGETLYQMSESK